MCGKVIEDDAKICPHCGAELTGELQAAAGSEADFTLNTQPAEPPRKKGRKGLVILIAVVAAVAVALTAILPGLLSRPLTPQQIFMRSMENTTAEFTQALGQLFSAYKLDTKPKEIAFSGGLKLELSDTVLDILNANAVMDMQWLQEISMDMLMVQQEEQMQMELGLNLAEQYILGVEYYYDLANMVMWLGVPELSDVFLYEDVMYAGAAVTMTEPPYGELFAILAEEKETVINLIEKTVATVASSVQVQDMQQQTMTAGSITQDLTVIRGYSNDLTSYQSVRELAQWLYEYDEFYDMIDRMSDLVESYEGELGVDLSQEIRDALAESLEADAPETEGTIVEYDIYLDADGKLMGMKIVQDGQLLYDMLLLTESDALAAIFVTEQYRLTVDLTADNGALSGSVKLEVVDGQSLTYELENLRIVGQAITGAVSVTVPEEVIEDIVGVSGISTTKIRIAMNIGSSHSEIKMDLLVADISMVTITLTGQMLEDYEIYLPESGVDITDTEAVTQWANEMSYDQVIANILAAGVPEELVIAIFGTMQVQ